MTVNLDRVRDRICKLFRVAQDDAASQGEIDNAMRAAQAMIAAHQLDEAELYKQSQQSNTKKDFKMNEYVAYSNGVKLTYWESQLGHFIVKLFGTIKWYQDCAVVRTTAGGFIMRKDNGNGKPLRCKRLYFYGVDEDAALAAELYTELAVTIATTARLIAGSPFTKYGRDYACGFVSGLMTKLNKVQKELSYDSTGTALVVQEYSLAVQQEAKAWLEKTKGSKLKNVNTTYGRVNRDASFYSQGKADGSRYDVSTNRKRKLTN